MADISVTLLSIICYMFTCVYVGRPSVVTCMQTGGLTDGEGDFERHTAVKWKASQKNTKRNILVHSVPLAISLETGH